MYTTRWRWSRVIVRASREITFWLWETFENWISKAILHDQFDRPNTCEAIKHHRIALTGSGHSLDVINDRRFFFGENFIDIYESSNLDGAQSCATSLTFHFELGVYFITNIEAFLSVQHVKNAYRIPHIHSMMRHHNKARKVNVASAGECKTSHQSRPKSSWVGKPFNRFLYWDFHICSQQLKYSSKKRAMIFNSFNCFPCWYQSL